MLSYIYLVRYVDYFIIIICWFVLSYIYLVRYVDYFIIIICWFVLSYIYLVRYVDYFIIIICWFVLSYIYLVRYVDYFIIIICWFVLSYIYLVRYVDYFIIIICWFVLSYIYLVRYVDSNYYYLLIRVIRHLFSALRLSPYNSLIIAVVAWLVHCFFRRQCIICFLFVVLLFRRIFSRVADIHYLGWHVFTLLSLIHFRLFPIRCICLHVTGSFLLRCSNILFISLLCFFIPFVVFLEIRSLSFFIRFGVTVVPLHVRCITLYVRCIS